MNTLEEIKQYIEDNIKISVKGQVWIFRKDLRELSVDDFADFMDFIKENRFKYEDKNIMGQRVILIQKKGDK